MASGVRNVERTYENTGRHCLEMPIYWIINFNCKRIKFKFWFIVLWEFLGAVRE